MRVPPCHALLWTSVGDSSALPQNDKKLIPNLAYSFQKSLVQSLVSKTISAAKKYKPKTITLAGGVAANKYLREELGSRIKSDLPPTSYLIPDFQYCTDNAAMIGVAAAINLKFSN